MKRAPGTFGTVTISSSPFGSAASAVAGEATPTMVQSRVTSTTPSVARRTAARRGDSVTWVMSVLFISASISVGLPCGAGFGFGCDGAGAGFVCRPPAPRYQPRGHQWLNPLLQPSLPAPFQSETLLRPRQWSSGRPQFQTGGAPLGSTRQPATRRRSHHSSPTLLQVLTRRQRRWPPSPLQARIPRRRRLQSLARLHLPTRRSRQQRCLALPQMQIGGRPTRSTTRPATRRQPVQQRCPELLLVRAGRRRPPVPLQTQTRRRCLPQQVSPVLLR